MGQLLSSEEHLPQLKEALGSVIYEAMLAGEAVPDLRVVHPLLLTNQNQNADSQIRLQEHLQQVPVYNAVLLFQTQVKPNVISREKQ